MYKVKVRDRITWLQRSARHHIPSTSHRLPFPGKKSNYMRLSYGIGSSVVLKPAADQVADVVLAVSRDRQVVLGSLSVSIRRRGSQH